MSKIFVGIGSNQILVGVGYFLVQQQPSQFGERTEAVLVLSQLTGDFCLQLAQLIFCSLLVVTVFELVVEANGFLAAVPGLAVLAQPVTYHCCHVVVVSVKLQLGGAKHSISDAQQQLVCLFWLPEI